MRTKAGRSRAKSQTGGVLEAVSERERRSRIMAMREKLGPTLIGLLPTAPIVIPLAAHFILVNFAMLATMVLTGDQEEGTKGIWLPLTYIFYNIVFFQVGIWALQEKERVLPVGMFIFVVVVSAINDIIMLGANYANAVDTFKSFNNTFEHVWRFSAGMMILNLVGKPFTIALACVSIFFRVRAGNGGGDSTYQTVGN